MLIKLEISFNSLKVAIFQSSKARVALISKNIFYTVFMTILRSNIWREHIELTECSSAVPAEQARSKFFPDCKVSCRKLEKKLKIQQSFTLITDR